MEEAGQKLDPDVRTLFLPAGSCCPMLGMGARAASGMHALAPASAVNPNGPHFPRVRIFLPKENIQLLKQIPIGRVEGCLCSSGLAQLRLLVQDISIETELCSTSGVF